MGHHAFVIEASREEGVARAKEYLLQTFSMRAKNNPDLIERTYGLLSAEDARDLARIASQAPLVDKRKAIIIAANRAYHEAQNALLKLFEEPPPNTYLFLILPTLGGLLPTLYSRVQILTTDSTRPPVSDATHEFLKGGKEIRSTLIKRLTNGRDEEQKRELRDEAISLINGIEAALYDSKMKEEPQVIDALKDINVLRPYLYDRSAPLKLILEHLSLTVPKSDMMRRNGVRSHQTQTEN